MPRHATHRRIQFRSRESAKDAKSSDLNGNSRHNYYLFRIYRLDLFPALPCKSIHHRHTPYRRFFGRAKNYHDDVSHCRCTNCHYKFFPINRESVHIDIFKSFPASIILDSGNLVITQNMGSRRCMVCISHR